MNTSRTLSVLALSLLTATTLCAQPPSRGGGDRGRDGGDRGRGDGGGFRGGGGPPAGGFRGGGGPPGGGFRGGGGPPGGGDRSRRGGFDASSMLSRLDSNGNGVLDPSEQQGPASFLISRLQQSDPSIKAGQPIPLKKITDGFEKMRQQRDSSGSGNDPRRGSSSAADEAMVPELLVPGFGLEEDITPTPLLGFGAAAEMLSVPVTEEDVREAAERMRRYDSNRDGFLSKNEMSRFSGNPMDFDRNRDGKLSESELSVRYARRREGEEEARKDQRERGRERESETTVEIPDVFNGRQSYRATSSRKLPEGLPGFFTDKDANGDGQLTMAEFSDDWNDDVIASFFDSDFNRDGVITAAEALRAVEKGGASSMAATSTTSSSDAESASPTTSSAPAPASGKPDEKYVKVVQRIVERYDKNKDQVLTASEWGEMLMSPAKADGNRDGKITITEYALWMQSRQKK